MIGYEMYVWPSVGFAVLILALNIIAPCIQLKQLKKKLRDEV